MPSLSTDMGDGTPPREYDLLFFFLERRSPLVSEEWITAARLTERFTDHATRARHARTDNPITPSAAPTAIKTVPSGVLDFCMYGASAVGGTVTMGISESEEVDVVEEVVEVVVESVDEVEVDEVVVIEVVSVVVISIVDVVESEDVEAVVGSVDAVDAVVESSIVVDGGSVVFASVAVASLVVVGPTGRLV